MDFAIEIHTCDVERLYVCIETKGGVTGQEGSF